MVLLCFTVACEQHVDSPNKTKPMNDVTLMTHNSTVGLGLLSLLRVGADHTQLCL